LEHSRRLFMGFLALSQASFLAAAPVSIYVGPNVRDGFVEADQGVMDSVKDVKKELGKDRAFRVVAEESMADLKVYVLSRGVGPAAGGSSINIPGAVYNLPSGQTIQALGMSFYIPSNSLHIEALLRVGTYERPFGSKTTRTRNGEGALAC
jgi:hypothetical protein